jgi:hypothetical protein
MSGSAALQTTRSDPIRPEPKLIPCGDRRVLQCARWHPIVVHLYFDESGDFAFPADGFDAYVQAALICPDSYLAEMEEYVTQMKDELGVEEVHAAELPAGRLVDICRFIGASPFSLVGQATDTQAMTDRQITEHRLAQAAQLKGNLEQWKRAGGNAKRIEEWFWQHINRAALPQRVNNSEYVQADLFVGLIHAALFKSIVRYLEERFRDDLVDFHFILDGKLPGKLAAGEKVLNTLLLPRLGSNPYELVVPVEWHDEPVHPFVAKFSEGNGKLSLNRIFEHGLRFESSRDHAGLQLVDVVAYVTRRAILEPDNDVIHAAYAQIREPLRTERDGQALKLIRYTSGQDNIDELRYRLVL